VNLNFTGGMNRADSHFSSSYRSRSFKALKNDGSLIIYEPDASRAINIMTDNKMLILPGKLSITGYHLNPLNNENHHCIHDLFFTVP
jgi:hypothetical protein